MNPSTILILLLAIISFDFLLSKFLVFLNIRNMRGELPDEVKEIYDEEKYKKSIAYTKANTKFGLITSILSFCLSFVLLATGFFGWLDSLVFSYTGSEIVAALLFFGILFLASDVIQIPFQIYDTFVIEEKFGFNKTIVRTFIFDKLKGYALAFILGGLILAILLQLILWAGPMFWIWFWLVISAVILFINMFYTSIILPLFNKLSPLEDGKLKTAIESYSKEVNFPLDNIYVIDGSKRSAKSNAFFSGIGRKKKIVLYDTLINNHSVEELVAVLAHEVGHFKKKHIITGYILSVLQTGFTLFIMSLIIFNPVISQALGSGGLSIHVNLLAFGILYSPVSHIFGIFMNMLSRKNEFEADHYAKTTYDGAFLQQALKKLSVDNLVNLFPHPAYVFFNYSHPPLLRRLAALEKV